MGRRIFLACVVMVAWGVAVWAVADRMQAAARAAMRPCNPAMIEVLPPGLEAGRDVDAVWQRKIMTVAARMRFVKVLEETLRQEGMKRAIREHKGREPHSIEALDRCLTVRQIPGTAMLEVWVDCGGDREICAAVTADMVNAFWGEWWAEVLEQKGREIGDLKDAYAKLREVVTQGQAALEDFASIHDIDSPREGPPAAEKPSTNAAAVAYAQKWDAYAREQADRARWIREYEPKKRAVDNDAALAETYRRRMLEASLAGNGEDVGLRVVQRPTP